MPMEVVSVRASASNSVHARDYIQTAATGNIISRRASIYGAAHIVLGGKCIVGHHTILRGDLQRSSFMPEDPAKKSAVSIVVGRYVKLDDNVVLRPPSKLSQGIGDFVHIGSDSVVEASQIGNYVDIGQDTVVGPLCVIQDCAKILPGSVLAPETIVPSMTVFGGSPGKFDMLTILAMNIEPLNESYQEITEDRARQVYKQFCIS